MVVKDLEFLIPEIIFLQVSTLIVEFTKEKFFIWISFSTCTWKPKLSALGLKTVQSWKRKVISRKRKLSLELFDLR